MHAQPASPTPRSGRPGGGAEQWYPFPEGSTAALFVEGPGEPRKVGVWTRGISVDRAVIVAPCPLPPGTPVRLPLQTVHGDEESVPGVVEAAARVHGGEHRLKIRFGARINAARFAVCWGVTVRPDGSLAEVGAGPISRGLRPPRSPPPARAERAANIVTTATELARRAADGAGEDELREIITLLNELLDRRSQPPP